MRLAFLHLFYCKKHPFYCIFYTRLFHFANIESGDECDTAESGKTRGAVH